MTVQTAPRDTTTDVRRLSPAVLVGGALALTTIANLCFQTADILFTDRDPYRSEGPVDSIVSISIVAAIALVLSLAIALPLSRDAAKARTGAMVLGGLSILTLVVFWSGAPAIFGACAAWLGGLARGSHPQEGAARGLGVTGAVIAVLCIVATWVGSLAAIINGS